jgi:cytochrome c5
MRGLVLLLACAGLAGCGQEAEQAPVAPQPTPAALSFEGAESKDRAAQVAHGKRLADILDCTGCHDKNFTGRNLGSADDPMWAPNVTRLLASYDDAALDRLLRRGVPLDGRDLWFMPVESYQHLSDADIRALIAFLRTVQPAGEQTPPFRANADFRKQIAAGEVGNAQVQIAKYRKDQPVDLGNRHAFGRYLAQNSCTACHNNALQGWPNFTPNLDVAGAYSKAELTHLLTTGEGKSRKNLGMMSETARRGFAKLTPQEQSALVDYLLARAQQPS